MGFLFSSNSNQSSKGRKNELSDKDRASLEVQRHRDRLIKYEKSMNVKIERETQLCRQFLREKKRNKAKLVLRKKKFQQNLMEKARMQLLNIEEMIENIESAEMQQQMLAAMKQGTTLLQQINSEMDIDEVEQLMDDTAEAIAYQQEINDILSQNLSNIDEDEVLKELEMIEQMEADSIAMEMPIVPNNNIGQVVEEEEEYVEEQKKQVLVQ